nr:basic helix-loop-helix leucine zipper transcription factor [Tanacetum cinerariifolium]
HGRSTAGRGMIKCPCNKCCLGKWLDVESAHGDILRHGFLPGYTEWIVHGEHTISLPPSQSTNVNVEETFFGQDDIRGLVRDAFGINSLPSDNTQLGDTTIEGDTEESTENGDHSDEDVSYKRLLEECDQELYAGWNTKGRVACPVCADSTHSRWLKHGKKFCYIGHRRWLEPNHSCRFQKERFDGTIENRGPPTPLTGSDVLKQLSSIRFKYGKSKKRTREEDVGLTRNEEPHCYGAGVTKSQISKFCCDLKRMRGEGLADENHFLKEKVDNQTKKIHTHKKQLEMCNKELETCKKQLASQNKKVESYKKRVETQGLQMKNMDQKLNVVYGMLKLLPAFPDLDNVASNSGAGTCDKQPSSSPSPFMDEDHYSPIMDHPSFGY